MELGFTAEWHTLIKFSREHLRRVDVGELFSRVQVPSGLLDPLQHHTGRLGKINLPIPHALYKYTVPQRGPFVQTKPEPTSVSYQFILSTPLVLRSFPLHTHPLPIITITPEQPTPTQMPDQKPLSQHPSTHKKALTSDELEASEKAIRASAGLHFYSPTTPGPGQWPSSIAAESSQDEQTSEKGRQISPLPAPRARKHRPTALDLQPWEKFKPQSPASVGGKRQRSSTPETETTNEAIDHTRKRSSTKPTPLMPAFQAEGSTRRNDSKNMEGGSKKNTSEPSAK